MMATDSGAINILLADDHSMIRQGVSFLIEEIDLDFNIFQASNFDQIRQIIHDEKIEIALLDAQFPEGNILNILPELKILQSELKILIFSGIEENSQVLKYIDAGANGFLSKLSEEEEIKNAIKKMHFEGEYLSSEIQNLLIKSYRDPKLINPLLLLTEREFQIAEMYCKGLGNLEISNNLDIKQNTVSTMKRRLFDKLKIENIVELVELMKKHN